MAFFILSEPITPSLFIGTLLVCSGVYLTNKRFTPHLVKSTA
jgi:drug/metabolite transporter (DMT)-like permease